MTVVVGLAIGLVVSLLLAETLSIAPGGYIVPGYIAVNLGAPGRVLATIGVAVATLIVMKAVGQVTLLYGMRRFVLYLLTGFTIGMLYAILVEHSLGDPAESIGFVVPGLIAGWMDRQGMAVTLGSMMTVAVLAGLVLLVLPGV
ncbi:MAG TPA: poly-gamma-glutamate biosynthesis protein PgsC [Actinomycetota bacterium]|nr:poly-gamma-glutamate biosynthesis protein PgsC [Actinomycetota bacterium]